MKKCNKCQVEKPLTEYHKCKSNKDGLQSRCKLCVKKGDRKYKKDKNGKTKSHILEYARKNYIKNKPKYQKYHSKYNKENKDKILQQEKENYHNCEETKLARLLRSRFYDAVKYNRKKSSILELLGCPIEEYKLYLEQMFLEPMNWSNHGDIWEIDHIIPISKGGSWHYTNTQPLFKTTTIAESFGYKNIIGNKNKNNKVK